MRLTELAWLRGAALWGPLAYINVIFYRLCNPASDTLEARFCHAPQPPSRLCCTPGAIRTHAGRDLNPVPLPLGYRSIIPNCAINT